MTGDDGMAQGATTAQDSVPGEHAAGGQGASRAQADRLTDQAHQALSRGDGEAANRLFDEAIAAREGPGDAPGAVRPAVVPDRSEADAEPVAGEDLDLDLRLAEIEVLEGEALDRRFAEMRDGRLASQLRAEWGADAGRNLAAAQLAFTGFFQELHGRSPSVAAAVRAFVEDEAHDLGNDPSVIAAFAALGRQAAGRSRAAGQRQAVPRDAADGDRDPNPNPAPADRASAAGEQRLNELTEQAWAAMADGRRDRASTLFAERDALAGRLFGGQPPPGRL